MPQHNEDLNDRLKSGDLPADGAKNVVPITHAARQADEDAKRVRTVKQLLGGAMERAAKPADEAARCTTGHYWVDRATGGIQATSMWVIGAETNWGKSTELVAIADENLQRGKRVLIVSNEDSESLYGNRLMCRRCSQRWKELAKQQSNDWKGSSSLRLRDGRLYSEEFDEVTRVAKLATDDPVFLFSVGKKVEWVAKRVRALIAAEGIDLVLFDYLQAFDNERPQSDRRLQLNYICRVMTDAVKESGKAGVIASQLTIPEGKKRPDKNSIRDSRDVSNGAEVIGLGYVSDNGIMGRDGKELVPKGGRCLYIDKVKDGPAKKVFYLPWDSNSASFDAVHRSADDTYSQLADEYKDLFEDDWIDNSDERHP